MNIIIEYFQRRVCHWYPIRKVLDEFNGFKEFFVHYKKNICFVWKIHRTSLEYSKLNVAHGYRIFIINSHILGHVYRRYDMNKYSPIFNQECFSSKKKPERSCFIDKLCVISLIIIYHGIVSLVSKAKCVQIFQMMSISDDWFHPTREAKVSFTLKLNLTQFYLVYLVSITKYDEFLIFFYP